MSGETTSDAPTVGPPDTSATPPEGGRQYKLLGPDGFYQSERPGNLGGYRPKKIYGRLDCPSALNHVARGTYGRNRVFFADEETAVACGFRPCAKCMPDEYRVWKFGK